MSRGTSGSSLMEGNWRRPRTGGEDEEGWRVASHNRGEKWGRFNIQIKNNKINYLRFESVSLDLIYAKPKTLFF